MVQEQPDSFAYLSLGQAAAVSPGRPSTNCVWRWCRRGVLARSGTRVRLEHVRVGGKIFTTADWVQSFFAALAAADSAYFDQTESRVRAGSGGASGAGSDNKPPRILPPRDGTIRRDRAELEQRLKEVGL
jgi:hypothetical protein